VNELPNVVIVMGRCRSNRQDFGIRFEEKSRNQWTADWTFAVKESAAKKEGFDRSEITGSFGFDRSYPGCPHCHATSAFKCGCGKVACWDGETRAVICPWCSFEGELNGAVDSLGIGRDR